MPETKGAAAVPVNRDSAGRFIKGQSGNPQGRKRLPPDVKQMLKAATPEAVRLLLDTMENREVKPELRVKCAETVLDRVYGKSSQPIENNVDGIVRIVLEEEAAEYGG